MKQSIEDLAKDILLLAQRRGIDAAEVFIADERGLELELRDQQVEKLRNTQTTGFGLRVLDQGRLGFVQTSDLRREAIEKVVEKACALARLTPPDPFNVFTEPTTYPSVDQLYDSSIANIGFETKVRLLADIESLCYAYDPAIKRIEDIMYSEACSRILIANTSGLFASRWSTHFTIGIGVIAERDGEVESGSVWTNARFFEDLESPSEIVSRACSKAVSLLGSKKVASMIAPVIFDKEATHPLLTHIFALINGQNVADGTSMLAGRIGERIGSDLVTVVDDATLARRVGSREFDDEGSRSQRNVVIEKGILKSFLFNNRSAKKLGRASTGNASRESYSQLPGVALTNFFLEAGQTDPADIIRSTEKGLFVVDLVGWWVGINPSTGDFSSGAKGYFIEKGEIVHPVRNITLASNTIDMLKTIDAVGKDFEFRGNLGSPTIRVSQMCVGA